MADRGARCRERSICDSYVGLGGGIYHSVVVDMSIINTHRQMGAGINTKKVGGMAGDIIV